MREGLVIVNTGFGKGKTTAALGTIFRAWGRGMRICVIQFIKTENTELGEFKTAQDLGIEWHNAGDGFTWQSKDIDASKSIARLGWELAKEKMTSGSYDLLLLDEFTYPLHFGWLDTSEVIQWLSTHKPADMHLIITGRFAPKSLIEFADLVSDMTMVKHHYETGVPAIPGIEY
jgi:cob(I)alamin adenosyltransferase